MSSRKIPSAPSKILFKLMSFFGRIFYKKVKIEGLEKLSGGNKIIVANHAKLNGPIIAELYMPENCYTWANGQMVRCREVPKYAMEDFFSYKPRILRPIYKLASYILAILLPTVINNARVVPVYRDLRIASTFRNTIKHLEKGDNIIIFPECHIKDNNIVNRFQEHFVDVARLYYRKYGVELEFLPMYLAPNMGRAYIGEPIRFNSKENIEIERKRLISLISEKITALGRSLPEHLVVPFDNIPSREYISNKAFGLLPGENK